MRGEALNVGLLFESESGLQVRCSPNLEKIKAISGAISAADLRNDILEIPAIIQKFYSGDLTENSWSLISDFTPLRISGHGTFDAPDRRFAENQIDQLFKTYVEPEPAGVKAVRKRSARLRASVKRALRDEKILAGKSEGIDSHRILTDHKLSEGVVVDFLLKNGAIHVCEAIDASDADSSFMKSVKDIAMSALTFEHARMRFEKEDVKPRLIFSSSQSVEKAIMPSLKAAEHQGAQLVNWASDDDRRSFLVEMAKLAEPLQNTPRQETLFHSSALPSSKLN
jgi:hypothetical protein